jgi:prepilin-type N-terminal cleavage/methylation domain-containing protein
VVKLLKNEKGSTLIEVVIAIAVLGIIAAAFLPALSGASKAIITADERTTAESLARSQIEYVRSLSYSANYTAASIPPQYAGYSATISVASVSDNGTVRTGIQKIVVIIYHNVGGVDKPILTTNNSTLEDYRVQ